MSSKFYAECASILSDISNSKTTLKTEVYKKKNPKRYMAILSQVIKFKDDYEEILSKIDLQTKNKFLSLIYVHEVLNGNIKVKNSITKCIKAFGSSIDKTKSAKTFYIRLNTRIDEVRKDLQLEDTQIPFIYKTNVNVVNTDFYRDGKIVIQNISSCLPAYFLNPAEDKCVIDCCAAPGNKTSQLSMMMNNTGSITAYEKDAQRFEYLEENIEKYKCLNVKAVNMDFLDVDVDNEAEYLLVDPSCSGSGIHDLYEKSEVRIKRLATFQKKILMHAMRFKNAKAISYSTCSIHEEENEEVVQYALENNQNYVLRHIEIPNFDLLKNGNIEYSFHKDVIRVEPDKEKNIHGFFVAVFERK